tara:strand:+ start:535 stop:1080 length:546 start_codon:yes stop_codon:yes gene_type:complete
MPTLLDQLAGGHPSTIGRAHEVARQVLADRELLDELFDGIAEDNPTIRHRSIRAVAEVSAEKPDWLAPHKDEFFQHIMAMDHWIVRANVCKILPRFPQLTAAERRRMLRWAENLLDDSSSVAKTCALDCFVRLSLAPGFSRELTQAGQYVERSISHGDTPALRARARKLRRMFKQIPRPTN